MVSRYGSPNGHWANTPRRPVRRPDANLLAGQGRNHHVADADDISQENSDGVLLEALQCG
jgi:hypothetical protein